MWRCGVDHASMPIMDVLLLSLRYVGGCSRGGKSGKSGKSDKVELRYSVLRTCVEDIWGSAVLGTVLEAAPWPWNWVS